MALLVILPQQKPGALLASFTSIIQSALASVINLQGNAW